MWKLRYAIEKVLQGEGSKRKEGRLSGTEMFLDPEYIDGIQMSLNNIYFSNSS